VGITGSREQLEMKQDDVVVSGVAEIKGEEKEPGINIKLLATGENVSLSLLEAQPGKCFEVHEHSEEELCYIHQGRGIMTIGDKTYDIVAPAVVKVPPHIKHGLQVTGTETLLKVNAHSPPRTKALKKE
jgi:mannose-6-phosphate isomerase-like protein (cupin superfamily)